MFFSPAVTSRQSINRVPPVPVNLFEDLTWTRVGTTVVVSGGRVTETAASSASWSAEHAPLGETLSDTSWRYDFDLRYTATALNTNTFGLHFTDGTADPIGTQDMMGVGRFTLGGGMEAMAMYKDGGAAVQMNATNRIVLTVSTQYYGTVERTSTTNMRISVYSDEARTSHLTNSPQNTTIPSTIDGLTHVMVTTRSNEGGGTLSDVWDNLVKIS